MAADEPDHLSHMGVVGVGGIGVPLFEDRGDPAPTRVTDALREKAI